MGCGRQRVTLSKLYKYTFFFVNQYEKEFDDGVVADKERDWYIKATEASECGEII